MTTYYNEHEPFAARWLENLAAAGHIGSGRIDDRDIQAVEPRDLAGFERVHFFAGIGGWDLALRQAGWPEGVPVWTGSAPCQPFSAAGQRKGFDDERHLWPEMYRLIRECRPPVVFGEQVARGDGLHWLDVVSADLEAIGYAFGAADLAAAGVGAPHIRQRLYWVAYANEDRRELVQTARVHGEGAWWDDAVRCGTALRLAYDERERLEGKQPDRAAAGPTVGGGPVSGFWSDAEWIPCRDGKWRPAQPGIFPLADGIPGRVGKLRASGNAICVPLAAEFVRCAMGAITERARR